MKKISKNAVLCYMLSFFVGMMCGYFIYANGARVLNYLDQNLVGRDYPLVLDLDLKTGEHYTDTLTNIKSGEKFPVRFEKVETDCLSMDIQLIPLWVRVAGCLCGILSFVFFVYALRLTGILLKNVREGKVFTIVNACKLRSLGIVLAVFAISNILFAYIDYWGMSCLVDFEYYRLDFNWLPSAMYFMTAVFSLLASEVFAIGLKMKEEQDLTI